MRSVVVAVLATLSITPALAGPASNPMDPINQFITGMNHNDMKSAAAAYAPTVSIIDEFPPHHWQGATAFSDWGRDFAADAKKNGISDPIVTLDKPIQSSTTGDRSYVVVPATYAFKQHGKQVRESGAIMTFALQRVSAGWRIAGWSWSARETAH